MSVRRTVALVLSAALALTGLAAVSSPAAVAADTAPYEVTIDPLTMPRFTPNASVAAVGTGVQLDGGDQTRWQSLAGEGRMAYSPLCGEGDDQFGYGDMAVCLAGDDGSFTVHDFAARRTYSGSADYGGWLPLVAGRYLVQRGRATDNGFTLRFFGYGEDAPADREVLLQGASDGLTRVFAQDGEAALLGYYVAGTYTVALLDFAAGTATPLPQPSSFGAVDYAALDKDRIVLGGAGGIHVLSRAEPTTPGHDLAMPEEAAVGIGESGLVGDWFISRIEEPGTYMGRLWAFPLKGGASRELGAYVRSGSLSVAGPDGSLYMMGMTDSGLSGVQRVALGADGVPRVERALALGEPYDRESMTLSQGRLVAQTSDKSTDRRLQGYDLALSGTHAATGRWSCDSLLAAANCPQILPSATYPRWWTDTGDGRLVTLENVNRTGCAECAVSVHVTTPGSGGSTRSVVVPYATALTARTIVRASGRYVHFYALSGNVRRSIVADIETGAVLRDSTNLDQSLWGGQLWTGSSTNGTVSAVDVRTGAAVATADLGTGCGAFTELAVTGRWIFRRCASDSGAVVVHDRERRLSVWTRVPRDAKPLLGDGFLAYSDTLGSSWLYVEDVRSGEAEEWFVGQLAWYRDQYVGQGWTVDRFGGGVAFVDPWESVRITGLGGTTSRLTAIDADTPAANIKSGAWKPRWWLSKPGSSWTLTLRHKVSGKTVRTLTGGEARGIVAPSWDGKDAAGKYVANGAYTWSLTVKPADGQGADLTASGNVAVSGAGAVWRDMAGDDGFGDLLAMDTAGAMSLYRGTGAGALASRTAGIGNKFPIGSVFVPVGDLNGDRCADVYVRVGGDLRAYRPGCGKVVTASSPYTLVGGGWGGYDVLTSPGDVNGDGYADLIARQASTGDVYFYGGTATHALKARVRIGVNWKLYRTLVGAGDLNGDGRGDLLGVDSAGVLWRYYGTSTGGVSARVKVGGGWGVYSALVGVGDLSGGGRADLVARTTDGKLYRYASTGSGTYGGRVLIGAGGWNGFKGLF
ncbi:FG-GAP-like repeat-containing protein [Streptomyces hydrogenans]|uniref:FG-GAP-like repeat-containing protein n=1 Tax=Streptomyces hydrogenans TaxID=1873719 RepID=UPI0035D892B3